MKSHRDLMPVVNAAVEATYNPGKWPDFCTAVAHHFGATGFMIFEYDFLNFGGQLFHCSEAIGLQGADLVRRTLATAEIPPEELDGYMRFATRPRGRLIGEYELYDVAHDREMPPNPFRREALEALGSRSRSVARMNDVGPWADVAALHLPDYAAERLPAIRQEVESLFPMITRTLEANRIIRGLTQFYAGLLQAFDMLDFGAALVTAEGRLVHVNSRFRELAHDRDGLLNASGVVETPYPVATLRLRQLIAAALDPETPASGTICALPRRSGKVPLIARAAPLNETRDLPASLVLLLIVDPADELRITTEGLQALDLLSQAELEVCAHLVRGATTEEIAERRSTSITTTRNQVKSASAKLDCTSRLDLVRLAMATRPPVRA